MRYKEASQTLHIEIVDLVTISSQTPPWSIKSPNPALPPFQVEHYFLKIFNIVVGAQTLKSYPTVTICTNSHKGENVQPYCLHLLGVRPCQL
jgi:hypothetical protein